MIKCKIIKKKKRNPYLEDRALDILSQFGRNIKFEYLNKGSYAETYYFVIKNSNKLKPGEYVLKVFNDDPEDWLSDDQIKYLSKLSNYGLIPKIYYIDQTYMIMKYIKGKNLKDLVIHQGVCVVGKLLSEYELNLILEKVAKLLKRWHELGFVHGDIHLGNILVTDSMKIYLIDPDLLNFENIKFSRDFKFFKEIYTLVNCGLPQFVIENEVKRLFS